MLYNLNLGYLFNLISCLDDTPSASLSACVQGHNKPVSTSGPLSWLFLLAGMPFPGSLWPTLSFLHLVNVCLQRGLCWAPFVKRYTPGISLLVQGSRLHAPSAGGPGSGCAGSIPSQGTIIEPTWSACPNEGPVQLRPGMAKYIKNKFKKDTPLNFISLPCFSFFCFVILSDFYFGNVQICWKYEKTQQWPPKYPPSTFNNC